MANEPNSQDSDDIVHGKDLLTRALDAFFGKAGDMIHGAAKKDSAKDKQATSGKASQVIEAQGSSSDDPAPSSTEASGTKAPCNEKTA